MENRLFTVYRHISPSGGVYKGYIWKYEEKQ